MPRYVNIKNISKETNAYFDTFAAQIQNDDIAQLHRASKEIEFCANSTCGRVMDYWVKHGLIPDGRNGCWCAHNIALVTIFAVLKKRGMSVAALRQISNGLMLPMYENISVLDFGVLLCRHLHDSIQWGECAPYLIIDGENRLTLCLSHDLYKISTQPEIATYSHTVLNLAQVLDKCDFIYKIGQSPTHEFIDLPPQIIDRFYDPTTASIHIDMAHGRMQTISHGTNTAAPKYGERTIKYQDGHIVADIVKTTEKLNV